MAARTGRHRKPARAPQLAGAVKTARKHVKTARKVTAKAGKARKRITKPVKPFKYHL
jgi:hypothetical protein